DAVVTGSRSIMVLAFIEAGDPVYGPDLDRRVLYSDFYVGFVRALRVETNHIKSGDDPIGHMPGLTNLQFHPVDGKLYGTSLGGSNQVLRMDLAP
ncbi:MAG: hypothetical protein R3257_00980, partial [bacterium]|nr:hypothetical protein [bacterium]